MSDWISVEDRLPKDGQLVVAAKVYEYSDEPDAAVCWFLNGIFVANNEALEAENFDGGAVIQLDIEPTHWMTLPPPPTH